MLDSVVDCFNDRRGWRAVASVPVVRQWLSNVRCRSVVTCYIDAPMCQTKRQQWVSSDGMYSQQGSGSRLGGMSHVANRCVCHHETLYEVHALVQITRNLLILISYKCLHFLSSTKPPIPWAPSRFTAAGTEPAWRLRTRPPVESRTRVRRRVPRF